MLDKMGNICASIDKESESLIKRVHSFSNISILRCGCKSDVCVYFK